MKTKYVVALCVLSMLCGCGKNVNTSRVETTNQVEKVLQEQTAGNPDVQARSSTVSDQNVLQNSVLGNVGSVGNTAQTIPALSLEELRKQSGNKDIDIDMTVMNSDMIYASVFNILNDPASYEGCSVRMQGKIVYSFNDDNTKTYANVIVADALACCAQGLEFQWGKDGEHKCPDDYPAENTDVVVTGTLETYEEPTANGENYLYFRIGDADMVIISDNT